MQKDFAKNKGFGALGAVLLLIVVGLFFTFNNDSFSSSKDDLFTSVIPRILVNYANDSRSQNGLGQLTVNPVLVKAAQLKADDMVKKNYFAHTSPEGVTPWHWFDVAGYDFSFAGENLAVNFSESNQVANAWMKSPKHKANILNTKYSEIGIAIAEGQYKGKKAVYVVQMFGQPRSLKPGVAALRSTNKNLSTDILNAETDYDMSGFEIVEDAMIAR